MRSRVVALSNLTLAAVLVLGACAKNTTPPPDPQVSAPLSSPPPVTQIAPDLPPLPALLVNAARPPAMTRAAYEFAARHPEVLRYVPCFCGCESRGHQGNHDCFVADRDEAGKVTAWDIHGLGCQVCIDVSYQASQLHAKGASVTEIRAAIDRQYDGATFHTPTPMPPSGGGHPQTP